MKKITVAAASIANYIGEYEKSIDLMKKWAIKAKEKGAELILFPELSLSGYITAPIATELALPAENKYTEKAIKIAHDLSMMMCYGFIEKEGEALFCTHIMVGQNGIIGKQRKIHVPKQEYKYWNSGKEIKVFDVGLAKIGISICRDSFFPEYQRTLYFEGAELVLMPFSYYNVPRSKYLSETHHGRSIQVNSWNNGFYSIVCNSAENRLPNRWEKNGKKFPGWCGILNPWGQKLVFSEEEGNNETMVVHELDPKILDDRRTHENFLAEELKPELYKCSW